MNKRNVLSRAFGAAMTIGPMLVQRCSLVNLQIKI